MAQGILYGSRGLLDVGTRNSNNEDAYFPGGCRLDGKPPKKFVIAAEYAERIECAACREARELLIVFRAEGSARIVADYLTARV